MDISREETIEELKRHAEKLQAALALHERRWGVFHAYLRNDSCRHLEYKQDQFHAYGAASMLPLFSGRTLPQLADLLFRRGERPITLADALMGETGQKPEQQSIKEE